MGRNEELKIRPMARHALVVVVVLGLLATVLPSLGVGVAFAQDWEVSEDPVLGADPLPVPVFEEQPVVEPAAPQDVTLEMSFGPQVVSAQNASVSAASVVPVGPDVPVQVAPKGRAIQGLPVQLHALKAQNATSSSVQFTVSPVSVDRFGSVPVESSCASAAASWSTTGTAGTWVDVPSTRIAAAGYYYWCARTNAPGARWTLEFLQVESAAKLGLLGVDANNANVKGVNVATGNWVVSRSDVSIPTIGPELGVHRVYNSASVVPGPFGEGWTFNYDIGLSQSGDDFVLANPDGSTTLFKPDGVAQWKPAVGQGETETLVSIDAGYELRHLDGGTHLFEPSGRLSRVSDAAGNEVVLAYDQPTGQLSTVTDSVSGRALQFDWTGNEITSVTAPDPRLASGGSVVWTYEYGVGANSRRLHKVCEPRASICEGYRWDTSELTSTFKMDAVFSRATGGADGVEAQEVVYDGEGRVLTLLERPNDDETFATTFQYSAVGNLLSENLEHRVCSTNPTLSQRTNPCDATTNGVANVWVYGFSEGRFASISPVDAVTSPTRYYYDEQGRRYRITDPLYDETLSTVAHSTELFFDDDSNLIAERNGAGEYRYFDYDADHNLISSCDHRAGSPLGSASADFSKTDFCVEMEYDSNRLMVKRTTTINPGNVAVEQWFRNGRGLVTEVWVPTSGERTHPRDSNGRLIQPRPNTFDVTRYTYDGVGNLNGEVGPQALQIGVGDDYRTTSGDNDSRWLDGPEPLQVSYKHNGWGQTTKTEFLRQADNRWIATSEIAHGPTGLITQTLGPLVTNAFSTEGQGRRLRTITTYTPDGLPKQVSEASVFFDGVNGANVYPKRRTSYDYDRLGREIAVRDAEGFTTTRRFDKIGNVVEVCDGRDNCQRTTYGSDNLPDEVIAVGLNGGGNRVLQSFDHDVAGRLVRETTYRSEGDSTAVVYRYDDADRVIRELIDNFDGTGETRRLNEFVYAANGTGYLERHLEGGRYDPGLFNNGQPRVRVFVTTEFEHTLSGLVKKKTVGTGRPHDELNLSPEERAASGFSNPISTTFNYAASGRVTNETLQRGADKSRTLWSYEFGKVATTQVAKYLGRTNDAGESSEDNVLTSYAHDERGNLTSTTTYKFVRDGEDPNGEPQFKRVPITTDFEVDNAGRTFVVTAPSVQIFDRPTATFGGAGSSRPTSKIGYNVWDEVTHEQDPNGNLTVTTRDRLGRPALITHPSYDNPLAAGGAVAPTEGFTYDGNGNLTEYVSRRGFTTFYDFDDRNQVSVETVPLAGVNGQRAERPDDLRSVTHASFDYDLAGNLDESKDKTGGVTRYKYNDYNFVTEERVAGGTRNVDGQRYDLIGSTTTYTYDSGGHLETTTVGSSTVTQKWNPAGELVRVTDAGGAKWQYTYDTLGNPLTITDPEDHKTLHCYDGRGNRELTKYYGPSQNSAIRNDVNCDPDTAETFPRKLQWKTRTRYDRAGRIKAEFDADDVRTSYGYDDLGRLSYVALPAEDGDAASPERPFIRYGYDAAGNLKIQIDGRGKATRFTYNAWNLQETLTEPGNKTWMTGYNRGGQPTHHKDPTRPGQPTEPTITRTYYENGLPHTERAGGMTRVYGYDAEGRQTSARVNGGGEQRFHYDARGALFLSTGPTAANKTTYTYHADSGLLATRTDPASRTPHEFEWNNQNELESHTDPIMGTHSYTYNNLGQVLTERATESQGAGKGYLRSYNYDDAGRPDREIAMFTAASGAETEIRRADYTWTLNGDIDTKTITTRGPDAATNTQTHDYDYDAARRLTRWSIDQTGSDRSSYAETYGYDKASNRTSLTKDIFGFELTNTWTYDDSNQIVSGPDGSYSWNRDGTLSSITDDDGGVQRFTFDDFNQLSTVTVDGVEIDYGYDPLGRLSERSANGATDAFTYAGRSSEPATYGTRTRYSRGVGGELVAYSWRNDNGTTLKIDVDLNHHGDVDHERFRGQGELKTRTTRTPFGEPLGEYSAGVALSGLGFQGDFTDPTTGDVNMGARWYTPSSGTFRNRDSYPGRVASPRVRPSQYCTWQCWWFRSGLQPSTGGRSTGTPATSNSAGSKSRGAGGSCRRRL